MPVPPADTLTPGLSERLVVQIDVSSWIQETFTVSPDSQRVAYVAQVGDKQFVVVDEREGKPYDGIVALATDRPNTRLVLMGWRGPITLDRVQDSIDKAVVREAPCDVAVLRNRGLSHVRRVLIPAGGGPHARLGLKLASAVAQGNGAELTVLRLLPTEGEFNPETEMQALRRMVEETLGEIHKRIITRVARSTNVVEGILAEAQRQDYDLLVIGASEEWFLKNLLFGTIPDQVAEGAPCSVLLVRKYEPAGVPRLRRALKRLS